MFVMVKMDPFAFCDNSEDMGIILKERGGNRYLVVKTDPRIIGLLEARLRGVIFPRPQTHALINNVIETSGAKIAYGLISKLENNVYLSELHLQELKAQGRELVINCQFSDALMVCVEAEAPLFCEEGILEETGYDENTILRIAEGEEPATMSEAEREKLESGPFAGLINRLNLDGI